MSDREAALKTLRPGDIFHADATGGASLIFLVTYVTELTIGARTRATEGEKAQRVPPCFARHRSWWIALRLSTLRGLARL